MSNNPINLGLCFLLELGALAALGVLGWALTSEWYRVVFALGIPLIAAAVWGVFRYPNDPGKPPVTVPGVLRLLIELAVFGSALFALYAVGMTLLALVFALILLIHYTVSYDRVSKMLQNQPLMKIRD